MTANSDLVARIDRIESHLAIQQLPIRYALAVDSRDLDSWVQLFVEDVNCGSHGVGREALETSWECLRLAGNLSSASVLCVLEQFMTNKRPAAGMWSILAAAGPGFCSELVLLRW